MCVSIYLSNYLSIYLPIYLSIYLSICICTFIYIYIYICICTHIYIYREREFVYIYIMCIYIYVCVYSILRHSSSRANPRLISLFWYRRLFVWFIPSINNHQSLYNISPKSTVPLFSGIMPILNGSFIVYGRLADVLSRKKPWILLIS